MDNLAKNSEDRFYRIPSASFYTKKSVISILNPLLSVVDKQNKIINELKNIMNNTGYNHD